MDNITADDVALLETLDFQNRLLQLRRNPKIEDAYELSLRNVKRVYYLNS